MKSKKGIIKALCLFTLILSLAFGISGCSNTSSNLATSNTTKQEAKILDKEMEPYYVGAAWLKDNMDKVLIIDARTEKEFKSGHIPSAVNVTWQALSNMNVKQGEQNWGVILLKEELEKKLGSFGIDGSKTIIVYNDPKGLGEEGRVLWSLRVAGLDNSKMLNGGYPAWTAAEGKTTTEATTVKPVDFKITQANYDINMVTTDYVKTNKAKIKLVDTRAPEEYSGKTNHGENYKGEKALGHIEGAIALCYRELYNENGTIKNIADLKATFEKAGLKPEDEIVTYCTVGIRSGFTAEILRMAGYKNAKNYNGSFSEWAGAGLPYVK